MTIHNDIIETTVNSLNGVMESKVREVERIGSIINGLNAIKELNGSPPVDRFLGETMTEERRQTIYDNCMAKAINILETE